MALAATRVILGITFVASVASIAAVCGDHAASPTPRPAITACTAVNTTCATARAAGQATPELPDPEALAILRSDPTIKTILGGLTAGRDYWLGFDGPFAENERGERLAPITIIFREEFHFAGAIPLFSDPCSGIGDEGHVPAGDPCLTEARTYRMEVVNWSGDSRLLHAFIDLNRHAVVDLFNPGISGPSVDSMIEYYRRFYGGSY